MDFSVVIPSRNRPIMVREALQSVLSQTHPSVEVIVVNDGSDVSHETAYAQLAKEYKYRVKIVNLEQTRHGHGPCYTINRGVDVAQGLYVCFLDDDDYWTDNEHLARAWRTMSSIQTDVYFTNQAAYRGDQRIDGPVWLEDLDKIITRHDSADDDGVYTATLADLMEVSGFGHMNVTVVRRSLYLDIGGMDENIRYEGEWDFFLRIIEAASKIRFYPGFTSHHNVPDQSKAANTSTAINMLQKMLFRTYLLDKAILFSSSRVIVEKARRHKSYTLKKITGLLCQERKYAEAYFYARQARAQSRDIKWGLYSLYLKMRCLIA